jgi:hypothetical protein
MTTFKLFSAAKLFNAALILSAAVATPAAAQQAIQEPGAYAFYHPNGDLGIGSSRPADAMASQLRGNNVGSVQMAVRPHKSIAVRAPAKRY